MKNHAAWLLGSAILAFAAEGWTGTVGELVSHSLGLPRSLLGVVGAALLGWLYSWLTAPESKAGTPKAHKRPAKTR